MANTKLSTMLATTAVLALAACGGGGVPVLNNPTPSMSCQQYVIMAGGSCAAGDTKDYTSQYNCRLNVQRYGGAASSCGTASGQQSVSTSPPTEDTASPPSSSPTVKTLKSYSSGSGVLSAEGLDLGGANLSNMVIATSDVSAATEIVSGAINLSVVPGTSQSDGTLYYVQRTGTASNGASLVIDSFGENLNQSGSEYASVSIVLGGNSDLAINSAGTVVNGVPNGTFNYTGVAIVANPSNDVVGVGTFTMQANFNSQTATIAATVPATNTSPQYFFSANDISVNPTTGNFSSVKAALGEANISSQNYSLNGYFAGTDATGAHGVLYPNSASDGLYGAFYGSR